MKKLLLLSVLVGLLFAGFLVGRVTAPAPLWWLTTPDLGHLSEPRPPGPTGMSTCTGFAC